MFEKLKNKAFADTQERFDTLVGRTTTIYGRLVLLDSVRIDGKVLGNIETAPGNKISVAIGPTGEVTGDITAHRVLVAGKVDGNIYAAERVEFHKDSLVNGDVSYGSIAVEHGARLLGMIVQNKSAAQSANRAQAAIQNAQIKSLVASVAGLPAWVVACARMQIARRSFLSAFKKIAGIPHEQHPPAFACPALPADCH